VTDDKFRELKGEALEVGELPVSSLARWPSQDLFKAIGEQAVKAAGVQVSGRVHVTAIPGDNENVLVIDRNGAHEFRKKPDPVRRHALSSCGDIVQYCRFVENLEGKPVVWIDRGEIVVTDDSQRLRGDRAQYSMRQTDAFKLISGLGQAPRVQADFLKLLRVDLARSFLHDEDRMRLISQLRTLQKRERRHIGQGSGSHEAGLVSDGNDLIEWPDSFFLKVQVFTDDDIPTTSNIEVCLDVRPEESAPFRLEPIKADLEEAIKAALEVAANSIRDGVGVETNVFRGKPEVTQA